MYKEISCIKSPILMLPWQVVWDAELKMYSVITIYYLLLVHVVVLKVFMSLYLIIEFDYNISTT